MEILGLNPRGQVPTLVDQSVVVCESGAAVQARYALFPSLPLEVIGFQFHSPHARDYYTVM